MIAGRFGMVQIKLLRFVSALTWLSFVAAAVAQSWHDDSRYVSLGRRTGYHIIRPGSSLFHQLGLEGAPISGGEAGGSGTGIWEGARDVASVRSLQ